jgi:hypothetical protein
LDDALWYPGVHCDSVVRAVKNRGQFGLGAGLGILNYYWLHEAVEALVKAGQSRIPKSVVAKLLIRYPVAFGLVLVAFKTGWLPPMAILAGLFVPVAGVLIEAIIQIGEGLLSPHPS